VMGVTATPSTIHTNQISSVQANFTYDSNGVDHPYSFLTCWMQHTECYAVPDGIPVSYSVLIGPGYFSPVTSATSGGVASSTYTPTGAGLAMIRVTADGQSFYPQINVTGGSTSTVGIFRNGTFYLASANQNNGGTVNGFTFGTKGDIPIAGNWTGSGKDTVGIFRNGTFFLASSNTNGGGTVTGFMFGTTGDVPIAGHWTPGASDTVGIFRKGTFYLASANQNNGGTVTGFTFGTTGDIPVVGDWTGSGKDTVGVFRNGVFYLASANQNNGGTITGFTFGQTGDNPVTGTWS